MQLVELLTEDLICLDLESTCKNEAIEELLDLLVENHEIRIIHRHSVLAEVLKREKAYSTGIGDGIAIPHARVNSVKDVIATLGISKKGINFDSIDGKVVNIVILLLTPANSPDEHLKTLANISKLFSSETLREKLLSAQNNEQIISEIELESENIN